MLCFSKSKMETEKLKEFVSPEGIFELNKFCQQERRTFFEVIESFPSSIPPLEYIIEKIPPIKPRFFTISSSSLKSPKAEITAAIVDYKTPYKRMKVGVCSDYLQNLQRGDKVHALVTKGSFVKPKNFLGTPLIGIGPGTGLAPLKAMAEERYFSREKFEKMALFLGHRYRNKDYLYGKNYWPQYKRVFEHFSVAFSRESGLKKHYVTHDLKTNSKLIWNLINGGALVFISGF
ncbi:hypothetical protein MHBO_003603 [Bonamia ostreae]|uniref:FAD-binding FR-type domain-containing protein n=1 Tax=Bonamia ostreae TaxID=126728 RepID=A0ABV2AQZ4_9EUKA